MNSDIRVRAFAKINLSLRVLGTRADGYHELRTVFQSIALHDTLVVRRTSGPFALTCNDRTLACDRSNLVWRAADVLWKSARRRGAPNGASVHLVKRIPLQAGLGGGSSDAAAALRALARIWRADDQCVREAAVGIGADVAFFLQGGTVLGLERGDVLFPLVDRPRAWVVIVVPPFGVSTPEAYRWWDEIPRTGLTVNEQSDSFRGNDLEVPVVRRHPEIGRIVRALTRAGSDHAAMSGSGSAVFGLFPTRAAADRAARALRSRAGQTLVTRTVGCAEYRRLAAN